MGGSRRKQVVAYKYYEDQHVVLALSNFDYISHFWFADKLAWKGVETGLPDGWSTITVNSPSLFGGEKREGGVSGTVHIGMGWPDQPRLPSLMSRLGSALMPAYRGVVSLFFEDFYFGNNPYIKPLKIRAQSIHKRSDGSLQWYDEKAAIPIIEDLTGPLDFDNGWLIDQHCLGLDSSYIAYDDTEAIGWAAQYGNTNSFGVFDYVYYPAANVDITLGAKSGTIPFNKKWVIFMAGSNDNSNKSGYDADTNLSLTFKSGGNVVAYIQLSKKQKAQLKMQYGPNAGSLSQAGYVLNSGYSIVLSGRLSFTNSAIVFTAVRDDNYIDSWTMACDVESIDSVDVVVGPTSITKADNTALAIGVNLEIVDLQNTTPGGDINPIHLIRECHTDTVWGGKYPESKMGSSYTLAADTLYTEGLGVSFLWTEQVEWKAIIEEVTRHIDGISYQDPETGLMEIKLIRDDYDVNELPVLDPSNSDLQQISQPLDHEIYNQVIIEFWNKETGEDDAVTLSDPAAVDMVGNISSKTYEYSGITNKKVATLVGNRDLARGNRPFHQGRIKTNRFVANLKPGDPFVLSSTDEGIDFMVCRVLKRSESTLLNGEIVLEFAEDVFGHVYTTVSQPAESAWVDPIGSPQAFANETAFEIPYYLIVQDQGETDTAALSFDTCFYGFAGTSPLTGGHVDYDLYVYPDGTIQDPDPEFSISTAFTPYAIVSSTVAEDALIIPVVPLTGMDSVRTGQLIMVGNAADTEREFLVLDGDVTNGDNQITSRRGLIDTIPKEIPVGTVLYFVEAFYGGSDTEYLPGEIVEGYGAPSNGRGSFAGPYTYHDLTMAGRFYKPYPPANLSINSLSFPNDWYVPASNQVIFNWNHRDRVTQSDQAIDWFDNNDYGPEASTTYLVESDAYDAEGQLITANWLSTNVGLVKTYTLDLDIDVPPSNTLSLVVRVWTIRDGEASLQAASYSFLIPGTEILVDEYTGLPVLDTDGNYILMETS